MKFLRQEVNRLVAKTRAESSKSLCDPVCYGLLTPSKHWTTTRTIRLQLEHVVYNLRRLVFLVGKSELLGKILLEEWSNAHNNSPTKPPENLSIHKLMTQ